MLVFCTVLIAFKYKTAVENNQNRIPEGVYIPLDWAKGFDAYYRQSIRCICLVMTERYIRAHFDDVRAYASVIENRGADEGLTLEGVPADNADFLARCRANGVEPLLIDDKYDVQAAL